MSSRELRATRAKLIKDAQAILNKPKTTPAEMAQVDRMLAESDALMAQITRLESVDSLSADLHAAVNTRNRRPGGATLAFDMARESRIVEALASQRVKDLPAADQDYTVETLARDKRIILATLTSDPGSLADDDQAQFKARFRPVAAGSEGTNSAGGYTVAPLFEADLLIALKAYGGMRQAARVITTVTGASLPWPTMDDTGAAATLLAENTTVGSGTDLAFGQSSLGAYTYISGAMPISLELLQDSVFDFDSLIRKAMVRRFAFGQNGHFTTGTGVSQPQGVVTAAASGIVAANGNTVTLPGLDTLFDLYHSVDPAYRANGSWMMGGPVLAPIRKLKDTQGHPLWAPSLEVGVPDTLLGRPLVINQQMPVMAANAKSILYGDFSNYLIRDTLGMQIAVLRERYADLLQVVWMAYQRTDGRLISAASPIKYFQNSAT